MKITITGASGFVGTHLQAYLKDSHLLNPISVRYMAQQQLDMKVDTFIHLAGKAHDLKKVARPSEYYEANYELTKQLFDAFLTSDSSVFIFMSTVKAVADEVNEILVEHEIPNPKTHYGIAKQQAEQYILNKELPEGKRVYILRPCIIHGQGNKGNLNFLHQIITKGLPWPLGAFDNKRSFLSVENLCFVIEQLLTQTNIPSGIYNVADDAPLSTNELIQLMAASQNKQARILHLPKAFMIRMAKLGDKLHLPLNTERLQKLTESYVVSNAKIKQAIGKPLPITSKEGLLKTFQSFKKTRINNDH